MRIRNELLTNDWTDVHRYDRVKDLLVDVLVMT